MSGPTVMRLFILTFFILFVAWHTLVTHKVYTDERHELLVMANQVGPQLRLVPVVIQGITAITTHYLIKGLESPV